MDDETVKRVALKHKRELFDAEIVRLETVIELFLQTFFVIDIVGINISQTARFTQILVYHFIIITISMI